MFTQLKTSFFPDDVQYWSYVDVWLPNDVNFEATRRPHSRWRRSFVSRRPSGARSIPTRTASLVEILRYVTTWVGGGSPRFWFSLSPQAQQLNYAQVLVELTDKEITPEFVDQVQPILTASLPGVRTDYRQLQTNPLNYPVEIRIASQADVSTAASAADIRTLRRLRAR